MLNQSTVHAEIKKIIRLLLMHFHTENTFVKMIMTAFVFIYIYKKVFSGKYVSCGWLAPVYKEGSQPPHSCLGP